MPIFLVGFSLGGNVVVKLAGELARARAGIAGGCLCRVRAARPGGVLAAHGQVRQPHLPVPLRSPHAPAPVRHRALQPERDLEGLHYASSAIDDRITAPSFGFGNAANYYRTQSAMRYLDGLRVPLLLIYSKDDTLVPARDFRRSGSSRQSWIRLLATDHGGHLGFLGRRPHRFWLDGAIVEWVCVVRSAILKI